MARLNPFSLPRPSLAFGMKTFTDPLQPAAEVTLCVQVGAGISWDLRRDALAQTFVERHVEGTAEGQPPIPVMLPTGNLLGSPMAPVPVTGMLCTVIATLMLAEADAKAPEPFSFEEWVALSEAMPTAFKEIVEWVGGLKADAAEGSNPAGNGAGASGAPLSDSPSTMDSVTTPESSSDATPSPS